MSEDAEGMVWLRADVRGRDVVTRPESGQEDITNGYLVTFPAFRGESEGLLGHFCEAHGTYCEIVYRARFQEPWHFISPLHLLRGASWIAFQG